MVAAVADLTSGPVLPGLRDKMLSSPEGRRILKERPRINTQTVDMHKLALLPEGSFGNAYVTWLERCGVTPDTREPVRAYILTNDIIMNVEMGLTSKVHYVDDPELAYVLQRYRECHDFYHCIVNLPVNVESELAVKFFEFANLGLPMAGFAAAFGHIRLNSTKRARLFQEYVPWAMKCGSSSQSLITVYWEERWEQDVAELRKELGIWEAPEARWGKALSEAKAAAEKKRTAAEQVR